MNTDLLRNGLALGIVTLLIVSAVSPIVFGYNIRIADKKGQISSSSQNDGPMDSAWSMFQHDARHIGRSPYGKFGNWRIEKWKADIGSMVFSSPAIDKDSTIYIGSNNRYFYAINSNGTEKWCFETGGGVSSSPAIAEDGIIYVGSKDGDLYAIYPNGSKKWSLTIGDGWVYSSPIIDNEGIIYAASVIGSNICAVYPNGTKKWDTTLGGWVYCTPGLDNNGTVYIGSNDGCMYAIYTSNGTIKWSYGTGDKIGSAPTIDDNGIIYFGSNDGYLYALYPDGSMKWRFLTIEYHGLVSSPAIDKDGNIIVGSGVGYVYSISPNGAENWRFSPGGEVSASPAIDKYGIVYIGGWDGIFCALNPDGTLRWKYKILDEIFSSAAIGEDGTIYIGAHSVSFTAYLYAIEPNYYNNAPEKPVINGPRKGMINTNYNYTVVTTDADGDNVSYYFDWGDGTNSGWTSYVPSGTSVSLVHSWQKSRFYIIKVLARDDCGKESNWAILTIKMPKDKTIYNTLFLKILDHFPLLERLLHNFN